MDAEGHEAQAMPMRIKNLDTGEEMALEEFDHQLPVSMNAHHEEQEQVEAVAPGRKKEWLNKGTKKLSKWAKSTLHAVKERIEESRERRRGQAEVPGPYDNAAPNGTVGAKLASISQQGGKLDDAFDDAGSSAASYVSGGPLERGATASAAAASELLDTSEVDGAELRQPLLVEDEAGPSSRAVTGGKVFLHRPARLGGGRRGVVRQLQHVRLIQELAGHTGVVWVARFSRDAQLLATGGRDGVLRVWSVYTYAAKPKALTTASVDAYDQCAPDTAPPRTASAGAGASSSPLARPPLLSDDPLWSLTGHEGDICDVSWSQGRLLLTAGIDQSVRLWYLEEAGECLRVFYHPDFVTSVWYHPWDPKRFVSGCGDGKVRVWSVPESSVVCSATMPQDVVTRVLFSADGARVLAGTLRGKARHYEFTGASLDYIAQLDVKNVHGSGRKVTGLCQAVAELAAGAGAAYGAGPSAAQGMAAGLGPGARGAGGGSQGTGGLGAADSYVISSADSRVRLYMGYKQERKFKGHRNRNTQIAASLSPSCGHIICGSDDGWVYVWDSGLELAAPPSSSQIGQGAGGTAADALVGGGAQGQGQGWPNRQPTAAGGPQQPHHQRQPQLVISGKKAKESAYEAFQTPEPATVTVAVFAPDICRQGRNEQPGYGPVTGLPGRAAQAQGGGGASAGGALLGALVVVAGASGRLYVYENLPAPPPG